MSRVLVTGGAGTIGAAQVFAYVAELAPQLQNGHIAL